MPSNFKLFILYIHTIYPFGTGIPANSTLLEEERKRRCRLRAVVRISCFNHLNTNPLDSILVATHSCAGENKTVKFQLVRMVYLPALPVPSWTSI